MGHAIPRMKENYFGQMYANPFTLDFQQYLLKQDGNWKSQNGLIQISLII